MLSSFTKGLICLRWQWNVGPPIFVVFFFFSLHCLCIKAVCVFIKVCLQSLMVSKQQRKWVQGRQRNKCGAGFHLCFLVIRRKKKRIGLPKEMYRYGEGKAGNRNRNRQNCAVKVVIKYVITLFDHEGVIRDNVEKEMIHQHCWWWIFCWH